MRNLRCLLIVLTAAIFCSLHPFSPGTAQTLVAGELQRYRIGSVFYALVVIPDAYRLSVRTPAPFVLTDLATNLRCDGFAITGAYSEKITGDVEGLVVVEGQQVSKQSTRNDGGFLVLDEVSADLSRVGTPPSWSDDNPVSVVQSHPILIMNGNIDRPLKDPRKANRVALGKLEGGSLFMAMAYNNDLQGLSAVTLLRFAQNLDQILSGQVDWLMNFDGGPSAFLTAGNTAVAPSPGRVVSYLCAEPG